MSNIIDHTIVVLCRPEGSLNIGSVCRGMKNMGFSKLRIAGAAPEQFDHSEIQQMAVHAFDLFENAEFFTSLEDALADTVISGGVTRRRGQRRKSFFLLPEEFAQSCEKQEDGLRALVFGNEQHGLSDAELGLCSYGVVIPSNDEFPSLNLSHAVQILTYTFFRESTLISGRRPVSHQMVESLAETTLLSLHASGVGLAEPQGVLKAFFSNLYSRAGLSVGESKKLHRLFESLKHRHVK